MTVVNFVKGGQQDQKEITMSFTCIFKSNYSKILKLAKIR